MMMSTPLRIFAFGGLRVLDGDLELTALPAQRLRCGLFVYLAVEREATRENVLGVFWPERDPERARHALHQTVYELRRTLGDDWIETHGERLRITGRTRTDAVDFERDVEAGRLADALELYAGAFLDGFYLADTKPFEAWADRKRAHFERLHRRARREHVNALARAGDQAAALAAARRWVELDPLDDEAQHRFIELLAESGQRMDAIRQYESYERELAQDELYPLDDTKELIARVRDGGIGRRADAVADGSPEGPTGGQAGAARMAGDPPPATGAEPPPVPGAARDASAAASGPRGSTPPASTPVGPAPPASAVREGARLASSILDELQRRRVFRVALLYAFAAFIVIQVANLAAPALDLPEWVARVVLFLGLLGFPIALVLAWAYDMAAGGAEHAAEGAGPPPKPYLRAAVLAMLAISLLAGAWALLGPRPPSTAGVQPNVIAPEPDPTRIAVLYFDDQTEQRELRYLADAVTEALIHQLGQVPALAVISRNGVRPYLASDLTVDSIARALAVGTLVGGSLNRSGDRLRVVARLIDPAGTELRSRMFERPWGDLFPLIDEVVREVAAFLRTELGREVQVQRWRAGTGSVEAWELVRRAEQLRRDGRPLAVAGGIASAASAFARADSLLARAERLDPEWIEPIVERGWVAHRQSLLAALSGDTESRGQRLRVGITHALRALDREPADAHALELAGTLRYHLAMYGGSTDPDERAGLLHAAEADLRSALAADPTLARGWSQLSHILFDQAEFAEARFAADQALRADAYLINAPEILYRLFETSFELGDDAAATDWCDALGEREPRRLPSAFCRLTLLAWSETVPANADSAWHTLHSVLPHVPPQQRATVRPRMEMLVAAVLARAGRPDSAQAVMARARGAGAGDAGAVRLEAAARAGLGEVEEPLRLLASYLEEDPVARRAYLQSRIFTGIRSLPAFQTLLGAPEDGR